MTPVSIDPFVSRITNHDVEHRSNNLDHREIELDFKQRIIDDASVKLDEVLGNAVQAAEKQATEINLQRAACRTEVDQCIKMCVQSDNQLSRTKNRLLKSKESCRVLREDIQTIKKENAGLILQHSQQSKDFKTWKREHNAKSKYEQDRSDNEYQKQVESHEATSDRLKKIKVHCSEI